MDSGGLSAGWPHGGVYSDPIGRIRFFPATFSPWTLGPEVLQSFWAQFQATPRSGLAAFAAVHAWLNLLFLCFSMIHRYQENPVGAWSHFRIYAAVIPFFFCFPWVVALVKVLL